MIAEDLMERRLAELRDRLYHAESLSQEREGDIHVLRNQLNILLSAHTHDNGYVIFVYVLVHTNKIAFLFSAASDMGNGDWLKYCFSLIIYWV